MCCWLALLPFKKLRHPSQNLRQLALAVENSLRPPVHQSSRLSTNKWLVTVDGIDATEYDYSVGGVLRIWKFVSAITLREPHNPFP